MRRRRGEGVVQTIIGPESEDTAGAQMCGKLGEPLLAVESGVLRIEQKVGGMIDVHEHCVKSAGGDGRIKARFGRRECEEIALNDGVDGPLAASRCQLVFLENHQEREPSMSEITTIGLDLAKHVFQVHGVDAQGTTVLRKRLRRWQVLAFYSRIPRCVVGLEACATAHYWARELGALGHEVRLMPAQYVKAYIKRNKHDAADAEAICEAVGRPTMRFVPVKTAEQQATQLLHRGREQLVRQRTMLVNALRAHLAEFGMVAAQGLRNVGELIAIIRDDADRRLPAVARQVLQVLANQIVRCGDSHGRLSYIKELIAWRTSVGGGGGGQTPQPEGGRGGARVWLPTAPRTQFPPAGGGLAHDKRRQTPKQYLTIPVSTAV